MPFAARFVKTYSIGEVLYLWSAILKGRVQEIIIKNTNRLSKTTKLILLDSLLQEAEHVAPSLLSDSRMTAKMELLP